MKLGTAWYGFRNQTSVNYFEMASALGLKYLEIPLYWQIIEDSPRHFNFRSRENIEMIRQCADEAGVRMVSSVANFAITPGAKNYKGKVSPSAVDFAMAAAHRAIDLGAELGLEVLRLIEPNVDPENLETARSAMEECGRAMRPLGDHAAGLGLRLSVENYGLTSEQVNWLLDAADHPAVGSLYDPCNFYRIGEDPLSALKNLGSRVYCCHLKDAFRDDSRDPNLLFEGSRWPPSEAVGEGEINWGPILKQLSEFYEGYLCIEYEMPDDVMRGTRCSAEYIRRTAREWQIDLEG
ncbi:MAG: sugar phosphate isomerase/epimerase [Spirochaetaceae bacterium]|nr:sugar phosphate isomerase/epimerase [Spirochaetaceae bacterium]